VPQQIDTTIMNKTMQSIEDHKHDHEVIIIDDDVDVLQEMWESVNETDHRCWVSTSATDALERILHNPRISIIITDLKMPGMNGLELISAIKRRIPQEREIGYAIVTGHASIDTCIDAIKLGVDEFLEKPITPDKLRESIDHIAANISTRRLTDASLKKKHQDQTETIERVLSNIDHMEHEVSNQIKLRNKLIYLLSDELRGPIATITMLADSLMEYSLEQPEWHAKQIATHGRQLISMFDLITNLLTKQGNSGNSSLTEINRMIDGLITVMGTQGNHRLIYHGTLPKSDSSKSIAIDLSVLRNILTTLISRITHDNNQAKRSWISVGVEDHAVNLTLFAPTMEDSGDSTDEWRAEQAHTDHFQNEISCTRILLNLYGGDVQVQSTVRAGAIITLTLPFASENHSQIIDLKEN